MRTTLRRSVSWAAALSFGLLVSACGQRSAEAALPAACTGRASAAIGGQFSLINQYGKPVSQADFLGRPALMYFGFTYCPDVCPLTLTRLKAVADLLGPQAGELSTIFVSVDPQRDTPEELKSYLSNPAFPAGIIGLTGSEDQVKEALSTFKVASQKTFTGNDSSEYTVSHTSIIYLMGKDGKMATFFSDTAPPEDIAACVKAAIAGQL